MEEKINLHRGHWIDKLNKLLNEIAMASLDQNNQLHDELLAEFETSALILWRYDRKLREERANAQITQDISQT